MAATHIVTVSTCAGPPISVENPPLGSDGKSRWLFLQVNTSGLFVGELYARKAGTAAWGK